MKEKNKYFENINYINFTPLKLKVNKTDYFSIQNKLSKNKNKYISLSYSNKNKINHYPLIRNPTHNFLYDKINLNILSSSQYLINKTIKNEKLYPSFDHYLTTNNNNNNNSKSVDYSIRKEPKKNRNKNMYNDYNSAVNLNNSKKNNDISYFSNTIKRPIKPIYIDNDISFYNNKYNNKIKLNSVSIYTDQNSNEERYNKKSFDVGNNKIFGNLNKIILIQSFWRSYFLRKLVVGGLEKYYSSIAMSKYLSNILYQNKRYLFRYFIEAIKDVIMNSKFSCFRYRRNKDNINIFFKNEIENNGSFDIPVDKKNDCINFFIKTEQTKSIKNKPSDNQNYKKFKNHKKLIDIYDYNWKNERKARRIKKNTTNYLNNEKCNKVNIKINLFNHNNNNNIDNKRNLKNKRFVSENVVNVKKYNYTSNNVYDNTPIKPRYKEIYTKKKIGEEKKRNNNNIRIMVPIGINGATKFNQNNSKIKENKKELNLEYISRLINIIKKKFFYLYFPLLVKQLKLEIAKIRDNFIKKSFFPKRNIAYYKKINNKYNYTKIKVKSEKTNGLNKIKVNKNNHIEKLKKYKVLKKLIEKKSNKFNNNKIISLTKHFLKWKNSFKSLVASFNLRNKKRLNNSESKVLNRYKSENISPKKHIKCKFKKSSNNLHTLSSSQSDKKRNSSLSSKKKMKIIRKYSEQKLPYSTFNTDMDYNCKRNLFVKMNKKEELYTKVLSIIKKLEFKNNKYKYFNFWKKEVKKK